MVSDKIVYLGDTHFGARKSSPEFHEYFAEFFTEFFKYVDANGIKYIVQVGDMFDVRNHITTFTLDFVKRIFVSEVKKRDLTVFCIVGNHDAFYKDKVSLNTVTEVIGSLNEPQFIIIDKPQEVMIGSTKIAMFPWICKENIKETGDLIKRTSAKIAVGHFEFIGFEHNKGSLATTGYSHADYSKFDIVISGHYHTASKKDNVQYTGTPYQLTWVDYNDPKGFWVHDETGVNFVNNDNEMFKIFEYPVVPEVTSVTNRIVRIKVKSTDSRTKDFIKYKDLIESMSPIGDVKVIELKDLVETVDEPIETQTSTEIKHPIDYVRDYISTDEFDADIRKLILEEVKNIFENLEKSHDII